MTYGDFSKIYIKSITGGGKDTKFDEIEDQTENRLLDLRKLLVVCLNISTNGEALAIGFDENFYGKLKYVTNASEEKDIGIKECRRGTFTVTAHA